MAKMQYTVRDFGGETSNISLTVPDLTAGNIAGYATERAAFQTALENIILGLTAKRQTIAESVVITAGSPTNPFAQRELKWLVRYHGVTSGKGYTAEIPTADLTGRVVAGTDFADLTDTEVAAFVTAWEGLVTAPDDPAEATAIDSIQVIGRNL